MYRLLLLLLLCTACDLPTAPSRGISQARLKPVTPPHLPLDTTPKFKP